MGKKPSLSPANAHEGSTTHKARKRRRCCCHRANEPWPSETNRGVTRARRVSKTTLPITAHPRPNRYDYASQQSPERRRLDRLGHSVSPTNGESLRRNRRSFRKPSQQLRQLRPENEQFLQDARYAARTMLKNPAFTALAALSLALGIGANTAIYSFMDAVMMRWLPVRDPGSLVLVAVPFGVSSTRIVPVIIG